MCRRHAQAQLHESGLCTDGAALLPQTLAEISRLVCKHVELKNLEAQEGTYYRVDWLDVGPVIRELRPRPAGVRWFLKDMLHIKAAAEHRRLLEQAAQEPSGGSSLPAAPTQGCLAALRKAS